MDEDGTNYSLSAVEGIIRLLDPLVKAGFIDAAPVLGNIYKRIDREKAISLYQWAAEAGDECAQCSLGNLYYEEYFDEQYDEYWHNEIDEPLEKAFHRHSLAANQGDSDAQRMLGEMYKDGLSVEDDLAEAFKWFKLAANQGDVYAQLYLGDAYQHNYQIYLGGERPPKILQFHLQQALKWYKLAAEQGLAEAQFKIVLMTSLGDEFVDSKTADYWLRAAAEQGYKPAITELRECISIDENLYDDPVKSVINNENIIDFPGTKSSDLTSSNPFDQFKRELTSELEGKWNKFKLELLEGLKDKSMHLKSEHPDPPLENLILNGEGPTLEFKETFSLDTKTNKKKSDEIRYAALREICGFLNTRDGTLIIGVSDSMEIVGIQKDGYDGNFDKYSLLITEMIANSLGALAASLVKIDLEKVGKKPVCVIRCLKSPRPIYCTFKGKEEKVFVRYGSVTKSPPPSEWQRWQEEKFTTVAKL